MKRTSKIIVVLAVLVAGSMIASAALIPYFGQIKTTAEVKQAVVIGSPGNWHNYNEPIEYTISEDAPGGETFCYKQWVKNRASIPVVVTFDTNSYNGIETKIYDLAPHELDPITEAHEGYGGGLFDFTEEIIVNTVPYFGWDPLTITKVYHYDCTVEFIIDMPRELGEAPDNFDLVFDANADNDPDWLIHWYFDTSKEPIGTHWAFKDGHDPGGWLGKWGDYQALPSWIQASPDTSPCKTFSIIIDSDKLGNDNGKADDCGLPYRFFLQAPLSDQGYPESWTGEVALITFPEAANPWEDSSDFEQETLGTEVTSITLQPDEKRLFCICYIFDLHIGAGTYVLTTTVDATETS